MKRKQIFSVSILILALLLLGCTNFRGLIGIRGSGNVVEEERDVSGFNKVKILGLGTLDVEFGDKEELVIEAEDNLMEHIVTEVLGDDLVIRVKTTSRIWPKKKVKFHLKAKKIEGFTITGSGKVEAPDISDSNLVIDINGSGKVNIDKLNVDSLDIEVSGSGDIRIDDGKVEDQKLQISGSGKYNAENLESDDAEIDISGSGNATVQVNDKLKVNISGSGNVSYVGDPTLDTNISGSGKLKKLDE